MAISPNIRKAAIFLASLPSEDAKRLLAKFDRQQISQLIDEISALDSLEVAEQREIESEFTAALTDHRSGEGDPFRWLRSLAPETITQLLAGEHPQTAALVISQLPRAQAVRAIAVLPADRQAVVLRRIAALGPVDSQIARDVAMTLRRRAAGQPNSSFDVRRCA